MDLGGFLIDIWTWAIVLLIFTAHNVFKIEYYRHVDQNVFILNDVTYYFNHRNISYDLSDTHTLTHSFQPHPNPSSVNISAIMAMKQWRLQAGA